MSGQTFIFCIGAAKAGTSWLFDYLYQHSRCFFPAVKELHYWDSLETDHGPFYRKQSLKRLEWLNTRRAEETDPAINAYQDQSIADINRWHDMFNGSDRADTDYLEFLGQGGDADVIGDVTPSYALLKEKTFKAMAALTDKVRFIYLLRDPVDRLWSQLRMDAGKDSAKLDRMFDRVVDGDAKNVMSRSNYRRTLNRVTNVIPRKHLHIELYERLFTPEAVERLCAFLGLAPEPAQFSKEINKSHPAALSDDRRAALQVLLKPQYNFCEQFLGELPSEWTQKRVNA